MQVLAADELVGESFAAASEDILLSGTTLRPSRSEESMVDEPSEDFDRSRTRVGGLEEELGAWPFNLFRFNVLDAGWLVSRRASVLVSLLESPNAIWERVAGDPLGFTRFERSPMLKELSVPEKSSRVRNVGIIGAE